MANIAASDLVYSFNIKDKKRSGGSAGWEARGTITFGNNTLTYGGSGGLPLTKGKMGLPRFIRSLEVLGSTTNKYNFSYVPSTEKLMLLDAKVNIANAGANADANAAIFSNAGVISHGIAAVTGATGVVLSELANVAITTTTIQVRVEGY